MVQAPATGVPATRQEPVEETIHGYANRDPFRWLEDETSPEVQDWVAAQNAHTESVLAARPERAAMGARLAELLAIGSIGTPVPRKGRYFYTRRDGTQNQPVLCVREGLDGADRVLLDPNTDSADTTVALDWWYPSDDGRRLAYGLSAHGDEKSTLYVLDVDSGARLPDEIPHTRYSSLEWEPDGAGFYYTRYPAPGSVPPGEENYHAHVFHHRLGTDPAADPDLFGAGREMTEQRTIHLAPGGRWLVVFASLGWIRNDVYVRDLHAPGGAFVPLVSGLDAVFHGPVHDNTLYLLTNWDAPNYRVLAVDLTNPAREAWRPIIAEPPDRVFESLDIVGGRMVLHALHDVASQVEIYSLEGAPQPAPALPPLGSITGVEGEADGADLFLGYESYTVPPTVYRYHLPDATLTTWAAVTAPVDLARIAVEQVWYPSKDGTRVPMFIIGPRNARRDGSHPTVLSGYGGFNIARSPAFTRTIFAWIEQGGIYAVANLRGGSEFGESWHRAGMRGNKQNVFDDFLAAAEYLIAAGYTSVARLGISGRSNGGLLVGAALTQRPDLFAAVVCTVPLLDMLRYHLFRIARLWVPEYGAAEDPEQTAWLAAYSPYQRVVPGTDYPAVLFTTADSDSRVDPLHALKMAALLQQASPRRPVLLWVEPAAGHGVGKPLAKQVAEQTDIWAFLAWQLGLLDVAGASQAPAPASAPVADAQAGGR